MMRYGWIKGSKKMEENLEGRVIGRKGNKQIQRLRLTEEKENRKNEENRIVEKLSNKRKLEERRSLSFGGGIEKRRKEKGG